MSESMMPWGEYAEMRDRAVAAEVALAERDEDFKMLRMLGSNAKYDEWLRARAAAPEAKHVCYLLEVDA